MIPAARFLRTLALAACILVLTGQSVPAGEPVVVAWPDSPPAYQWDGTSPIGQDADLLRQLAGQLDLDLRFQRCRPGLYQALRPGKPCPDCRPNPNEDRCEDLLYQGKADLMAGLAITPERQDFLVFVTPPLRQAGPTILFTRPGKRPVAETRDLYGKTIVVDRNDPSGRLVTARTSSLRLVDTPLDALRLVLAGKADLAGLDEGAGRWWRPQAGPERALEECPLVLDAPVDLHLAVSRKSGLMDRLDELEQALARILKPSPDPGADQ